MPRSRVRAVNTAAATGQGNGAETRRDRRRFPQVATTCSNDAVDRSATGRGSQGAENRVAMTVLPC